MWAGNKDLGVFALVHFVHLYQCWLLPDYHSSSTVSIGSIGSFNQFIFSISFLFARLIATHWMIMMLELTEVLIICHIVLFYDHWYQQHVFEHNAFETYQSNKSKRFLWNCVKKEKRSHEQWDVKDSKLERELCTTDERCIESNFVAKL